MREVPLVMPKMSMTMTEGTFLVWRREPGDAIKVGDVVCEVASDKVDIEVESPVEGTLSRLVAAPDQVLGVGEPLAFISSDADDMLEGLFDAGPADAPAEQPEPQPAVAATAVAVASPPSRRGPRPA
ncbi:MAG TPA: lipoyl domain-containing protein, partial [Mycobacterium sp.]|nr:lipoyl domain-containing protein [Mycobacterium sp.]